MHGALTHPGPARQHALTPAEDGTCNPYFCSKQPPLVLDEGADIGRTMGNETQSHLIAPNSKRNRPSEIK
jgi:hypothetical protein